MISELSHTLLNHQELSLAGDRIASKVESAGLGLTYVDGLVGLVKVNVLDFDTARNKSMALELTPEVQAADDKRDRRFKTFRTKLTLAELSDDKGIVEYASFLKGIVQKHNASLWALGLSEQSVKLKDLFHDLDKDGKAQTALSALGLTEDLADLKAVQADFEHVFKARLKEASEKEDPKVAESRKKLVNNLQALLVVLGVAEKVNEDTDLKQKVTVLVAEVNKVISTTMTTARTRITRGSNSAKEEK